VNHWGSVEHLIDGQTAIVDLLGKPIDSVKLGVEMGGCTMGSGSTNDFAYGHGQQAFFCSQGFSHFHSLQCV
jgi:hypothetical protein